MAGNVVSNVKKYYGGQVPVPGQGDSDGKVKVLVKKAATMEIGGVQTEVELLFDSDDLTTPVTPQQLGQWTDENYLIAFKYRNDEGVVRGFILYALETDSTSTDTLVNRATFVNFKEDMNDPGASAYVFEMVEDSSTLTRYLRDSDGELIVKFNQASVEAGAQSGTLDNLIASDSDYVRFEVVHEGDNAYLNLNTESLDEEIDAIWEDVTYIIVALDELPSDEHGYFNSSLYTTPGDGTTTNLVMDDFRISQGRDVHGDSIEFVPTHQEGGVDFGEVYLNPGTYILNVHYTLQWVGNPRGTFQPLVANVGEQPFDFSYEHEDILRSTRIVTKTTRGKFGLNFPFDADTPQMGIWVKNLEIAQIASYNHPAVVHDTTLTGKGQLGDPLGVTPAAFGKVKDIPTSIRQFRNGDVIPVDGPNGPAKMPKDDLLKETAQNALAGNMAPAFDQTRTSENPYKAGESVVYDGKAYTFKVNHCGAWSSADVFQGRNNLGVNHYMIFTNSPNNVSDLNDVANNSVIYVSGPVGVSNFPADFPANGVGFLVTTKCYFGTNYLVVQELTTVNGNCSKWTREYNSLTGSWSAWKLENLFTPIANEILGGYNNPPSLDDILENSIITIQRSAATTTTGFPSNYPTEDGVGWLITYKGKLTGSDYQKHQLLINFKTQQIWERSYLSGGSWSSWNTRYDYNRADILSVAKNEIFHNSATNPSSLNELTETKIYRIQRTSSTATTDFPADFPASGLGELKVEVTYASGIKIIYQTLFANNGFATWFRTYNSLNAAWSDWSKISSNSAYIPFERQQIFHDSATNPASLNDLTETKQYIVQRTSSTATTDFPADFETGEGKLDVYYSLFSTSGYQIFQILTKFSSGDLWRRDYNSLTSSWSVWKKAIGDSGSIITIGEGKMYSTLRAGLAAAYATDNATVYIYPGVYNCVEEWMPELLNISPDTINEFGNWVGKNMHIIALPGSKILANVERSDFSNLTDVQFNKIKVYFNPIKAGSGNYIIENMDIESKNTRYCVHDELAGSPSPAVHKYINCRMKRTNDLSTSENNFVACIGGGLGQKTTIVIDGGYYESAPTVGLASVENGDLDFAQNPISWHNAVSPDNVEASISIKNVYLADKGYFRFGEIGPTVEKCKVLISGCRTYYPSLVRRENTTSSQHNFEIIEYADEIVSKGHWVSTESGTVSSTWVPDNL